MTVLDDLQTIPGGFQVQMRRETPAGLIEFEYAPRGYLTKKGESRQSDWRAYFFTPADGKRERMLSVTTLLDAICPKGGLPPWAEARGIEGATVALQRGEITVNTDPADAVKIVRQLKLGADRARDEAAGRGLNVHALLEDYMNTGAVPNLADHRVEHHGYLQALCSWLLDRNPEPVDVEELVCDPEAGYAGRRDLVAMVGGCRVGYDAKTQENGGIYSAAHVQLRMYERAAVASGDDPCDQLNVVVFAANGWYREMPCEASAKTVDAALEFSRVMRPIDALCNSRNRAEKKDRA